MRVITGSARGRRLKTPEGLAVRPTTEKVKESIFSVLHFSLPGARFLDLFAGSGQMGIEALSRGAKLAVFVDQSKTSQEIIKDNLKSAGLIQNSRVVAMNACDFIRSTKDTFDIAFLDPPYNKGLISDVIDELAKKMSDDGIIVCEYEKGEEIPESAGDFVKTRDYKHSKTMVSVYKKQTSGLDVE